MNKLIPITFIVFFTLGAIFPLQADEESNAEAIPIVKDGKGLQCGFFSYEEERGKTFEERSLCIKSRTGIEHDRPFWLFTPSSYDEEKKIPVVIVLHKRGRMGSYRSGRQFTAKKLYSCAGEELANWKDLAEKEGFLLVLPLGDVDVLHMGIAWRTQNKEELVEALLGELKRTHNYDKRRVYLVGTGEGGHAAVATAVHRGDLITAVAVNNPPLFSGESRRPFGKKGKDIIMPETVDEMTESASKRKTPIMILAGTGDTVLKISAHSNSRCKTAVRFQDISRGTKIPASELEARAKQLREHGFKVKFCEVEGPHSTPFPKEEVSNVWEWLKERKVEEDKTETIQSKEKE